MRTKTDQFIREDLRSEGFNNSEDKVFLILESSPLYLDRLQFADVETSTIV